MAFEWDVEKAESNFEKHGARFSEALPVFDDDQAFTIPDDDSDPGEPRFVSIGTGVLGRVLVVVYCWRADNIRLISVRLATGHERKQYEEKR